MQTRNVLFMTRGSNSDACKVRRQLGPSLALVPLARLFTNSDAPVLSLPLFHFFCI
jgi:hypothetical protein